MISQIVPDVGPWISKLIETAPVLFVFSLSTLYMVRFFLRHISATEERNSARQAEKTVAFYAQLTQIQHDNHTAMRDVSDTCASTIRENTKVLGAVLDRITRHGV